MSWFHNALPLLKLLLAFVLMLVGVRLKIGLAVSVLSGSLALALAFGHSPIEWLRAAAQGLFSGQTAALVVLVVLILVLSDLLDFTGQTRRLVGTLHARLKRPRLALVFFPALIGLLPMPGGAVFSAPIVKSMADRISAPGHPGPQPLDLALINYWYRHLWELSWPLYPGVILAASLAGLSIPKVIVCSLPGPFLLMLLGWLFFLRPAVLPLAVADLTGVGEQQPAPSWYEALREGRPMLVAIVGGFGLGGAGAALFPPAPFEYGVILALALAIGCCVLQNRVPLRTALGFFLKKHLLAMTCVIVSFYVFKEVLMMVDVVRQIAALAGGGLALVAAAVFLPCLTGMVTGLSIGFVGASFPLLIGLVNQLGVGQHMLAYIVLGLFAGFAGIMASPLHICFILSCEYFHVDLAQAWRRVVLPCALFLATGGGYFFLIY